MQGRFDQRGAEHARDLEFLCVNLAKNTSERQTSTGLQKVAVTLTFDTKSLSGRAFCSTPESRSQRDRQNSLKLSYPSTFVQIKYKSSAVRQSSRCKVSPLQIFRRIS